MKKLLLLFVTCVMFVTSVCGQEDKAIMERLKAKYGWVSYSDMGGSDKCFIVGYSGKQGACDLSGKEIVPSKFDNAVRLGGIYLTQKSELFGAYNIEGKEITSPQWVSAVGIETGFLEVYNGKIGSPGTKCGLYNLDGKMVLRCEYEYIGGISSWEHKGFILPMDNGYYGMTDMKGNFILDCEYSKIDILDTLKIVILSKGGTNPRGNAYTPINAKWGIVNLQGKQVVPNEYDYIGKYGDGLFLCNQGGRINEKNEPEGGKFGYLDAKGNLVIPCIYDEASKFEDGVSQVSKDGISSILTNPLTGTKLQLTDGSTVSKVDTNIPETESSGDNMFAFIIANENYNHLTGAEYSINDGKVFRQYCQKTLGLPEKNVRYYEDATFGNFVGALKKMQDISDAYDGEAKFIIYFSGLGTTDQNNISYILPVDATLETLANTGYNLIDFMDIVNALKTEMTLVIVDAPFSGKDKTGKMLAQNRGIALRAKPVAAMANTILCISNRQEETARSDKKYCHSLFTYALLETLQATKGNCTIKESLENVSQWVKRQSMANYNFPQTPQIIVSNNTLLNTLKW